MTMVDDCFDPAAQKDFEDGLAHFGSLVQSRYGQPFANCTTGQKQELLRSIETGNGVPEKILSVYHTVKKFTIQAFITSSYYLTKVHVYELVPSRFHGCVAVKKEDQRA
jgi:hypothetical protein